MCNQRTHMHAATYNRVVLVYFIKPFLLNTNLALFKVIHKKMFKLYKGYPHVSEFFIPFYVTNHPN